MNNNNNNNNNKKYNIYKFYKKIGININIFIYAILYERIVNY